MVVVIAGQATAFITSRRQDAVGLWVMTAFAPVTFTVLIVVINILG